MDTNTAARGIDARHVPTPADAARRTPTTARPGRSSPPARSPDRSSSWSGLVQVLTREGFDLTRHPLSLLSLGDRGWVQIANFIVAGVLMLAFAVGARRSLRGGPGRVWAPVLFALYGVGLVLGGAFTADPALGFPAGTPDGYPTEWTFHGAVHAFAAPLAFLALVAVTFVVARRLSWEGHRSAAAWSRVIGVACLLLCIPFGPAASVRLFVGVALGFAWITAYAISLLRERSIAG